MRTLFRHAFKCPNCRRTVMRVSRFNIPDRLGSIQCGYCTIRFGADAQCISTSVVSPKRKAETELLCCSMLVAGLLASGIDVGTDAAVEKAREVFEKIKKGMRR